MRIRPTALAVLAATATATLTLGACGSDTAENAAPAASNPATTSAPASSGGSDAASVPGAGAYVTRADYEADPRAFAETKLVYFFHADWCTSCRATEKAIDDAGVPAGLTVVKVDYDSETGLRRKYGVTQQHTFVQVGADGAEVGKWTGSRTGADILAKTV